jgi:tetratricopeptide (TPR) repeat protein
MRKIWLAAGAAVALAAMTMPSLSMGGAGGGGGFGGGSEASFDDYAIAVRLIKHEQYAEAVPYLLTALAARPHDADILNYLGFTKRKMGDFPASLDYYKRALAIDPDHKGAHEYLGELYLQMDDPDSAKAQLATLVTLCPDGCDERDALAAAISGYEPPAGAGTVNTGY